MNLAEFLRKVQVSQIRDSELTDSSLIMRFEGEDGYENDISMNKFNAKIKSQNPYEDTFTPGGDELSVELNLISAQAILEKTIKILERCKTYEDEL